MKKFFALIVLLISATAFGAEAKITGPDTALPGDLVVLDASESVDATAFAWKLTNAEKSFLPIEDGRKIVFASGKAGVYRFVLAVAGVNDDVEANVSIAIHEVVIGTPEPEPGPDGFGLAPKVRAWLTAVDPAQAAKLKSLLLASVPTIEKTDSVKHADQAFTGILQANVINKTIDAAALEPFGQPMTGELNRLMELGAIATPADYGKAINEIAGAM